MQFYKRQQEKQIQKRIINQDHQDFVDRYGEWSDLDCQSLSDDGCNCMDCGGSRRYDENIHPYITKNNTSSSHNISLLMIQAILF